MRPVLIAGPTASGKSALALALAERDGGWVINADALQVYDCWRVLTARPDAAALARAPHRMYGHVPRDARYSVGAWLRDAAAVLVAARAAGARPIFVGGTGLYFAALTAGLAPTPPIPPNIRERSARLLAEAGVGALVADLARDDPATLARIDRRNPMRVQRAWEVFAATGRGLVAWQDAGADPVLAADQVDRLVIMPETSRLDNMIRQRLDSMVEQGALDECRRFVADGGDLAAPSGRALGAAEFVAHLDGRLGLADALDAAALATRRYAKRQRTWIRSRMKDWPVVDPQVADLSKLGSHRLPPG